MDRNIKKAKLQSFSGAFWLEKYGTLFALIALIIIFTSLRPKSFLTLKNGTTIIAQIAILGIVSVGLTYPLTMGYVDLSVGYLASLGGVTVVALFGKGLSGVEAIVITLVVVGVTGGLLNGSLVTFLRVPSLVVTIGTGFFFFGVTFFVTGGKTLFYHIPPSFSILGSVREGIPISGVIMIVTFIISALIIDGTVIGRYFYAIGNNEEASILSGINVNFLKLLGFTVCSILAVFAGIVLASKTMCGHPTGGEAYLMQGLAATFLGTSVFRKGEANVWGTLIGALIIGVTYNGISILGLPYYFREIMTGIIFIATLAVSGIKLR